jgi:hypothetical protein
LNNEEKLIDLLNQVNKTIKPIANLYGENAEISASDDNEILVKYFKYYCEDSKNMQEFFEKAIHHKTSELKAMQKQLKKIKETNDILSTVKFIDASESEEEIPDLIKVDTGDVTISTFKNTYIMRAEQDLPVELSDMLDSLNINQIFLEKIGGYTKLVEECKQEYTANILTSDVVDKILDYASKNKQYPTRQWLIKEHLISDKAFRKLNKVIKSKKLMDYIYNFCETCIPISE